MKKNLFTLMAAVAVLTSCAKEIKEMDILVPEQQTLMTKLVGGTQGEIIPGNLLIRMEESALADLNSGNLALFNEIEGITVTPAIPFQPKNMEVARKYGLHQWYSVTFDSQIKPETMASRFAALKQVKSVQYNRYLEPISDGESAPFEIPVLTRSEDTPAPEAAFPFNDRYNTHQWNLINNGDIVDGAFAGADVGVKDAWRLTGGDPSVVVAVFDCAVNSTHEDLTDALWVNEKELNGESGKDDDGNGFIDDTYGFNFVGCSKLNSNVVNDKLDNPNSAFSGISGKVLDWWSGSGHGTHVAGIVGATNNNGKGVSSIAGGTGHGDGVRLLTWQSFQRNNSASDAQNAAAFIYAADNGACIAQCSYGTATIITEDDTYINGNDKTGNDKINGSPLENAALRYFLDPTNSNHESLEGNMAIFAAGNHKNPYSSYPGALPYVISVTAFGVDHLPSGYTNYGPGCKIAAPGGEYQSFDDRARGILSTGVSNAMTSFPGVIQNSGREDKMYVYMQGTSMACPHVSGVVALGISYAKKLGKKFTREDLSSLLLTSVNDIDDFCTGIKNYEGQGVSLERYRGNMGTGAVDAWKFLMAIEGTPSVMVKVGEKCSIDLSQWLGSSAKTLSYTMSVDQATKESLGLNSDPVVKDGVLELTCTKIGAGKVNLSSAIGKDTAMENGIGQMEFSREVSIVSRPYAASNGGWF